MDLLEQLVGTGRGQYQADAIEIALRHGKDRYYRDGSLQGFTLPLFADVGTGKTPSTLVYLYYVREFLRGQGDPRANKPVLLVVPATVKWNWIAEARKWRPDLGVTDVWIIDGDRAQRDQQLQFLKLLRPALTVTNYETVSIHQQELQNLGDYTNPFFLAIVSDEAHYIKWKESQRARALRSVCAHFHMGLTGTPLSNKPDSLHGVVEWLDNTPPFMQTLRERPPLPNDNCPLQKWDVKRIINHSSGCLVCRNWNPATERCKLHETGKTKRKPFTDARPEQQIRYRSAGQWGTFDAFKYRYCEMEEVSFYKAGRQHTAHKVTGPNTTMMPELHDRLLKFGMIRWRRAEVLSLEPIIYEHVTLEPTSEQRSIYDQLRAGFIQLWGDEGEFLEQKQITSVLAQLTYFRRATTLTPREFSLSLQGRNPEFAPDLKIKVSDEGTKQEWLLEFVESQLDQDGNGDKFLVFSDWTSALRPLLRRVAKRLSLDILVWNGHELVPQGLVDKPVGFCSIIEGQTDKKGRQAISDRWNSDKNFKMLLGSPAAYEGINLQGGLERDDTAYVVMLNMPWLPKDVIQAIGRALRYGQDGQVVVLFLSVAGTIDQRMTEIAKGKQESFDAAIDGNDQNMAELFKVTSARTALDLIG